ncbi:sulfate transporter/antisigma-factor antagonist STAS [Candidatus Magnetobacterium bavaricum]|uniref:Sulfate transporter/antisigma-factor antagonist STAS n=1 Tax=Candidatus Magnetobacterium bavaricum TaxID=29290 RepID=A0A0F3H377_9BACT|nr:sulfate transporter/antisigma-factor antagonist STAS [Candidatus Magnetobacterium bavaricum]
MLVNMERNKTMHRLTVDGEMTIVNAVELKKVFVDSLEGCSEVEVDLSRVSEFDSAGFQLLLALKLATQKQNKGFRVTAHSPSTTQALKLYNMKGEF